MWRKSVCVIMWEGPYYREPSTAMVKAPEPSPSDLRPELTIRTLALMPQAGPPILQSRGFGTGPPVFPVSPGLHYQRQITTLHNTAVLSSEGAEQSRSCKRLPDSDELSPEKDMQRLPP